MILFLRQVLWNKLILLYKTKSLQKKNKKKFKKILRVYIKIYKSLIQDMRMNKGSVTLGET